MSAKTTIKGVTFNGINIGEIGHFAWHLNKLGGHFILIRLSIQKPFDFFLSSGDFTIFNFRHCLTNIFGMMR